MAETETNKTETAEAKLVWLGVPAEELPLDVVWTYEALGHERYCFLAQFGGYCSEADLINFKPPLDPRSFAYGVAFRRIQGALVFPALFTPAQRQQATIDLLEGRKDPKELCTDETTAAEITILVEEAAKLTEYINGRLGITTGTPRNETAVAFAEALKQKQKSKQR